MLGMQWPVFCGKRKTAITPMMQERMAQIVEADNQICTESKEGDMAEKTTKEPSHLLPRAPSVMQSMIAKPAKSVKRPSYTKVPETPKSIHT